MVMAEVKTVLLQIILVIQPSAHNLLRRRPQNDRVLKLRRHTSPLVAKRRIILHNPLPNQVIQLSPNQQGTAHLSGTLTASKYLLSPTLSR